MEEILVNAPDTKVHQAYDNWCRSFGASTWQAFWKFLEIDYNSDLIHRYHAEWSYTLTDESARKLELLLSPHHHAIITAYKIRKKDA